MTDFIAQIGTLAGVQALFSMLINIGKKIGLIKDGQAEKVNAYLQIGGVILLVLLHYYPIIALPVLDSAASQIAALGAWLFLLLPSGVALSHQFHDSVLRGLPLIGYSHSLAKAENK